MQPLLLETYPLSLRIPALLIRIVTVPKTSTAVLMTATPSATDEVFATALPPASIRHISALNTVQHSKHTLCDLIDYLLR